MTGISDDAALLAGKRLELLKAFSPHLKRVAMLWKADDRAMTLRYRASAATAKLQGFDVLPLGVREPDDFNLAFAAMDRDRPDAILMVADALTILNRARVFDYAAAHQLPAIDEMDAFARAEGLMSYGGDLRGFGIDPFRNRVNPILKKLRRCGEDGFASGGERQTRRDPVSG